VPVQPERREASQPVTTSRSLGLVAATSLIVGQVVGIGIFLLGGRRKAAGMLE